MCILLGIRTRVVHLPTCHANHKSSSSFLSLTAALIFPRTGSFPPTMECTLAVRTVVPLRASCIVSLLTNLTAEGGDLGALQLEGHPVFCLAIPQVDVYPAYHLKTMAVFPTDETEFFCMIPDVWAAGIPSTSTVDP